MEQRARQDRRDLGGRYAAYVRDEPVGQISPPLDDCDRQALYEETIRDRAGASLQAPDQAIRTLLDKDRFAHDFSRGVTPTAGFMVTMPGHRTVIPLAGKTHRALTMEIRLCARRREELLRQVGIYVGGRIPPSTNTLVLDLTKVVSSAAEARDAARAYGQSCFFDAQTQEEVAM